MADCKFPGPLAESTWDDINGLLTKLAREENANNSQIREMLDGIKEDWRPVADELESLLRCRRGGHG